MCRFSDLRSKEPNSMKHRLVIRIQSREVEAETARVKQQRKPANAMPGMVIHGLIIATVILVTVFMPLSGGGTVTKAIALVTAKKRQTEVK